MNTIKWILSKINGKKASIFGIIGCILVYLTAEGYIDKNLAELISSVSAILGIGINLTNSRISK